MSDVVVSIHGFDANSDNCFYSRVSKTAPMKNDNTIHASAYLNNNKNKKKKEGWESEEKGSYIWKSLLAFYA